MSCPEDLEKRTSLESNIKVSDYLESKTAIPHRAGGTVVGGHESSLQDEGVQWCQIVWELEVGHWAN